MLRYLILLLSLVFIPTVYAEDVVKHSGPEYLGCKSIGDTNIFLNDPNDYNTIKTGYIYIPSGCDSLPAGPKKIAAGIVIAKTQEEIDADNLQAINDQKVIDRATIDAFDISAKDGFTAFVKVYNTKVPAGSRITKQEIIDQIKSDRGL